MAKCRFDVDGFDGFVSLKTWVRWADGAQYDCVMGRISVHQDKDMLGWETAGKNTENFIVRVEGARGMMNIPGCIVQAITVAALNQEASRIGNTVLVL